MRAINTITNYENRDFTIGYEKWLRESFNEPSVEELDEMERDLCRSLTVKNRIVTLKPLNNIDYQPTIGA